MSGFTQAVLKYRWELWLFVGVPLVVNVTWVIESSRPELFTLPLSERQDLPYISPRAILLLLLLGLSYLRVRRLGRPTLALVWAYGVAAVLANALATVAIQVFGSPLPGSRTALSLVAMAVAWLSSSGSAGRRPESAWATLSCWLGCPLRSLEVSVR